MLLSDNGTEFWNQLLEEICKRFGIKQCFTVSYHPAGNGFVEYADMKILDVLHPVVSGLQHAWEDWLAYVAASMNSRVCNSTGQSVHYIIFGVEKRLPYDLLGSSHSSVYNTNYLFIYLFIYLFFTSWPVASVDFLQGPGGLP